MRIDTGLDTGDILTQKKRLWADETFGMPHDRAGKDYRIASENDERPSCVGAGRHCQSNHRNNSFSQNMLTAEKEDGCIAG